MADVRKSRVVIVASRFNESITRRLVEGAQRTLERAGVPPSQMTIWWVSGAFELPVAVAVAVTRLKPAAVIALGCLIKGETPQYLTIGQAVASGLTHVSVTTGVPVTFGVIIADSLRQAAARAGGSVGHRGREAASAALSAIELFHHA
ncbi:MAG: 6,7-dimethyl-8-ribityllumazine synthase [Candidatus Omnitrophica bacterium]|nr:6,7-dimethyl-8-ribityllumazine synthase [Candidatus Omnitrophota bacterium]